MDASAVIALCSAAVVVVGSILGAAWSLASKIGDLSAQVREVATTVKGHGQQLDRMESESMDRSHTLSGVRDRLATLEGRLGVGQ